MVSLSPVTALPRGMAVYPWGHCVSARSPVYGAWMARSAPPILGIAGTDDSGRIVAITGSSAASIGLLVSPPTA